MKQGQTYHKLGCTCGHCKMGNTRPDRRMRNDDGELMYVKDRDQICQATFKEHCQYPKCDCDRPVTAEVINSTEFPRAKHIAEIMDVLDGPEQECYPVEVSHHVTDPSHGGKVTCHKCNGFIIAAEGTGYLDHQHRNDFPNVWFHTRCYNPYEHYYGLDKGID